MIGIIFYGACATLGFGLPIAITIGIIAVVILNGHRNASQKELVKKIALLEEISGACKRALTQFPEHMEQMSELQVKEIINTMDALCSMKNKDNESVGYLFRQIDILAESIHKLYDNGVKEGWDQESKEYFLTRFCHLKKNIQTMQALAEKRAAFIIT